MATAAPAVRRVNLPVLILGAALALAGFGVTLLLALNSGPSATAAGNQPVVVAARDLDQRAVLQAQDLTTAHWAAADVPPSAVTSSRAAVGQVLLASLKRGQPVLSNQIGQAGSTAAGPPSSLTLAVSECQAEFLNWFAANASLKYTLLAHDDYAAAAAAPPDAACPAGGSSKGVTEADVRARWPALLG